MECLSPLVQFCRYMNVPIASAQDRGGSPELHNITQVPLVVTLFGEGEYSDPDVALVTKSLHLSATSSFAWSNITVLTILFSIRLTHFPNLISVFDFTLNRPFSWSGNHAFLLHPQPVPFGFFVLPPVCCPCHVLPMWNRQGSRWRLHHVHL